MEGAAKFLARRYFMCDCCGGACNEKRDINVNKEVLKVEKKIQSNFGASANQLLTVKS